MKAFKSVLLLILMLPMLALAQDAKPKSDDDWFRGKLFPPDVVLTHAKQLKLSDAQRKVIRTEVTTVQTRVATVDWDIMEAGLAMQEAIETTPIDRALVVEKADKVFEAEARKKRAWIEMLINIKNALNAEQIAYLRKVTLEGS